MKRPQISRLATPADKFVMIYPRRPVKRILIKAPLLGRLILFAFRAWMGLGYVARYLRGYLLWMINSREWTNFTFNLTDHSWRELVEFLHVITNVEREAVRGYLREAMDDVQLHHHISNMTSGVPFYAAADKHARLGRRLGWYALVRIVKPMTVVESGIDKGLGTCAIAAALLRNQDEGSLGTVYALDIESGAGWLIGSPYDAVVSMSIGDSHKTLDQIPGSIDLFIHDSDHSYMHEFEEYQIVAERSGKGTLILSDNAHKSTALMDFSEQYGLKYYFWPERPDNEFYPAGGIGFAAMNEDSGHLKTVESKL